MPLYEYHCEPCNLQTQRELPVTDAGSTLLCSCGSELRRVWTAPALSFVKGEHKNSQARNTYSPQHRTMKSRDAAALGHTDDSYERVHNRHFAAAEKRAKQTALNRRGTRREDGEIRKIGEISMAEMLTRVNECGGDAEAALDPDHWKQQGRIFKHEQ